MFESFKVHPRKMRIESALRLARRIRMNMFQGASSQNEDWKAALLASWETSRSCFKVHPRKMRIESNRSNCRIYRPTMFQGASSQNEDWKDVAIVVGAAIPRVSRCILAKWGLKAQTWLRLFKSARCFKVHPRKMRIESITNNKRRKEWSNVSRCILAKWGLKERRP